MNIKCQKSIDYLLSFTNLELKPGQSLSKKDFSLENITKLLNLIDNPQNNYKSIHIAGSKGKGSTSAIIESALRQSGKKTGLFTSPHLINYTERFRVNGTPISQDEFIKTLNYLKPYIDKVPGIQTFEIMTALGFKVFSDNQIDYAVIEVGLGGKLDASNVIVPLVSVITPIFLEHTHVLGDSIESIAIEKAGIIKSKIPVVISHQPNTQASKVFKAVAAKQNCQIVFAQNKAHISLDSYSNHKMNIIWKSDHKQTKISTALLGQHQIENIQTAITTLNILGVDKQSIISGLGKISWPGRFDIRKTNDHTYIFDASHVKESMEVVVDTYQRLFNKKAIAIYGSSSDKNVEEILAVIKPITSNLIITKSSHPRSKKVDEIEKIATKLNIPTQTSFNISEAIALLKESDLPILVTGSFFVVGETMKTLGMKI